MSCDLMKPLLTGIVIMVMGCSLGGCTKSPEQSSTDKTQSRVEPAATVATAATQGSQSASPPAVPSPKESTPPPKPNEIKEAVARVFEKVAAPDLSRSSNSLVGDFNGDGSEDIAVAITVSEGGLAEVNNELANWSLEDPKKVSIPGRDSVPRPPSKPVQAEKGDTLLAIIHGVGATGWRNPEAKQTYVLKNGVGSGMTTQSAKTVANRKDKLRPPAVRGDVIRVTIGGSPGVLFWTGAKYAWYSPGSE